MLQALSHTFMQNALAAGLLASVICGVVGAFVVVNRLVFLSGGIAHAAYGGVGLAVFLGLPFLPTTLAVTLLFAMAMAWVTHAKKESADAAVGALWAVGMALGVLFLDLTPGYNADLMSYLFGSILAVPKESLWAMCALAFLVTGAAAVFYNGLLAMSFDPEFARLRGVRVRWLYLGLVAVVSMAVVLVMRVVGLILVIALLSIPAAIAGRRVKSLWAMCALSTVLCALFVVFGLWLSYSFDISSGAAIILVAGMCYLVSLIIPGTGKGKGA
jgi:zinc transport system permease protein